jgi:hypothetical protein
MEHLHATTDRRAPRAPASLNNASDINRLLSRRSESVDTRTPRATELPRSTSFDNLRFLYHSQSPDQPGSYPTFYQANQLIAGPTNTRSGNLALIGSLAVAGAAYTSYIEVKFALPTLEVDIEYAALARFFYSMLPNPINQIIDTFQFQGVAIGLHKAQESHAQTATSVTRRLFLSITSRFLNATENAM